MEVKLGSATHVVPECVAQGPLPGLLHALLPGLLHALLPSPTAQPYCPLYCCTPYCSSTLPLSCLAILLSRRYPIASLLTPYPPYGFVPSITPP